MKRFLIAAGIAACLFSSCKKEEVCEMWTINYLARDKQPGCYVNLTDASTYGATRNVCGDELNSAKAHLTLKDEKRSKGNTCFTTYIQYLEKKK